MKNLSILILATVLSACGTFKHSAPAPIPAPTELNDHVTTVSVPVPEQAINPDQDRLLSLQDKLNVFASPKYLAHVQAAKAAGSDATQNACMDVTVEIGADIKAKPLISIPHVDMTGVDTSCGWCVLSAQRKAAEQMRNGPSLLTQIADARKRVLALARKGLVGCAPLKEDMRLSLLTPENAAADLLTFLNLAGEQQP